MVKLLNPGDYVGTRIRGGTHEGHVSKPWQLMDNFIMLIERANCSYA